MNVKRSKEYKRLWINYIASLLDNYDFETENTNLMKEIKELKEKIEEYETERQQVIEELDNMLGLIKYD